MPTKTECAVAPRRWQCGTRSSTHLLLTVALLLLCFATPALAIEPFSISIGTVAGVCLTIIKLLWDFGRIAFGWYIGIMIALFVLTNVGYLAEEFGIFDMINSLVGGSENCEVGARFD